MKSESPATKGKRRSYEFEKIRKAFVEECAEAGIAGDKFLTLTPRERRIRLKARMRKWGFKESEIPTDRIFQDYWQRLKSDREPKVGLLQEA